jgi:uroporphyrinogen decarboxylase
VYMIEGGASPTKAKAKAWLYKYPEASHRLLQALTDILVDYLVAQHEAGAQALQVFETVGAAELTPEHRAEFVVPYLAQIASRVRARVGDGVPLICFSKDTHADLPALAEMEYDVLGLDWKIRREAARAAAAGGAAAAAAVEEMEAAAAVAVAAGDDVAAAAAATHRRPRSLQGNLDPAALHGGAEVIHSEVRRMLGEFGTQGLIANLGHGLTPSHTPAQVGEFVHAVQTISKEMNEEAAAVAAAAK